MHTSIILAAFAASVLPVQAISACPFLGPGYPAPVDVSSQESPASKSWSGMVSTIEQYLHQSIGGISLADTSFSIAAFSLKDLQAGKVLQYHYTSPATQKATVGVNKVDGDTIYRVGSISKLFTVYTTLVKLGNSYWERPVTDFIPQLAAAANSSSFNPIINVDWRSVTLGTLASQLSGVTRDITDLSILYSPNATIELGFPPLNLTDPHAKPCSENTNCTTSQFLQEIIDRPPTYAAWTTPIYSNSAFNVLAIALEAITGESFENLAHDNLIEPLGMINSGVGIPTNFAKAVVADNDTSNWSSFTQNQGPAGGFYSTVNDMARLGLSILNSTLLTPAATREWLKPITHTAALNYSVGRPWEIYRYTQPSTGRINDLYSKGGDVKGYDSELVLSPDHQAGFGILTSSQSNALGITIGPYIRSYLADIVTNTFVSGLEEAAASQAAANLAGTYKSADPSLNSSITFKVDPSQGPGLIVESWINNNTGTFAFLVEAAGVTGSVDLRLFPTNLKVKVQEQDSRQTDLGRGRGGMTIQARGGREDAEEVVEQLAFRGSITTPLPEVLGLFSSVCTSWEAVDAVLYGKRSVDEFVFDLDKNGRALAVHSFGFDVTLQRQ